MTDESMSSSSAYWPARIGRLELERAVGKAFASYVDPLDGREYHAGREQGGRHRRGWWALAVDASTRSGGYRDFRPADQDDAIRRLRSLASADVGAGEWSDVSIDAAAHDQAGLDTWGTA